MREIPDVNLCFIHTRTHRSSHHRPWRHLDLSKEPSRLPLLADSLERQWLLLFHAAALRNCGKKCCDPLSHTCLGSQRETSAEHARTEAECQLFFFHSCSSKSKAKKEDGTDGVTVERQWEKPEFDKALRIPSSDKNMRQQRPSRK